MRSPLEVLQERYNTTKPLYKNCLLGQLGKELFSAVFCCSAQRDKIRRRLHFITSTAPRSWDNWDDAKWEVEIQPVRWLCLFRLWISGSCTLRLLVYFFIFEFFFLSLYRTQYPELKFRKIPWKILLVLQLRGGITETKNKTSPTLPMKMKTSNIEYQHNIMSWEELHWRRLKRCHSTLFTYHSIPSASSTQNCTTQ